MNILIIGVGYVGLATGISLAIKGYNVRFYDKNKEKITLLKNGKLPFFEPKLQKTLIESLNDKRVIFFDNFKEAIANAEVVFICVGTPIFKNGDTNSKDIEKVAMEIKKNKQGKTVIVIRSTVNPKVYNSIKSILSDKDFHLAVNPEFLREGKALDDTLNPSRIVVGTDDKVAKETLKKLYSSFDAPKIFTDPISAILIKYASNSFLAVKISFINEIANLSDKLGGNIDDIAKGLGLDPRIGKDFLKAGIGFGGSCLPKDAKNIVKYAKETGINLDIIDAASKLNDKQYKVVIRKLKQYLGSLNGKKIAVFGLSFKGGTDDLRNSVSFRIISDLLRAGAILKLHDYLAWIKAKELVKVTLVSNDPYLVAEDTDAIVIATDWNEYLNEDWKKIKSLMKGNLIIDGRNILDGGLLKKIGFIYEGIGRK
ncbi:MAG: UDP-glucose dehydrogenase family protein [Caldisericum sp.]|uniref:UDP-glucose dehydrogenase family protein n=1 Tax=Caldisericum sp. TaxID=2499687 RepID=UPI003D13E747